MITFKKILLPTDFSEASFEALKIANDLAVHFAARLYIVHSIDAFPPLAYAVSAEPGAAQPTPVAFDIETYRKELEKEATKKINEAIDTYVSKELTTSPILMHGNPAEEIGRITQEKQVDLIVISTHGTGGFKHLLFGSVAERLIRTATCPVLTVRIPEQKED